jgi:hypothetical protein
MGATTTEGTGPGDARKRVAYLSSELPKLNLTKTTSNPQDLITDPLLQTPSTSQGLIGIEQFVTGNGTPTTGPFTDIGSEFIWNSFLASVPHYPTTTNIWAPFGSATSYITFIPAPDGTTPDKFSCSKNIRTLRFYTLIQTSTASTSRWRVRLYVNDINVSGQNWGSPPNGVANMRIFNVLEHGGIAAGSLIHTTIEMNTLPTSTQNNNSYCVVEYDI